VGGEEDVQIQGGRLGVLLGVVESSVVVVPAEGAEEEASGGRPDLIEASRVGAAPGLRIVTALDRADRQEEKRLDRRVLLAGLEGELGIAVRFTEAHARVHLQAVAAHAEQQVPTLAGE